MSVTFTRMCSTLCSPLKSALCIIGPKGTQVSRQIVPDPDLEGMFRNGSDNVKRNLQARRLNDLELFNQSTDNLYDNYKRFTFLVKEMKSQETERNFTFEEMRHAKGTPKEEEMKQSLIKIKARMKSIQKEAWAVEDACMHSLLLVPNPIDPKTPREGDDVIYQSSGEESQMSSLLCHEESDHIEFEEHDSSNVFLKGPLAIKELELLRNAQLYLQKDEFADIISSPDLVKSTVIEGCDPLAFGNPKRSFALEKTTDYGDIKSGLGVHLVGSASFPSMASYFVKNVLNKPDVLPIHWFSVGRQYRPSEVLKKPSLFSTKQSSCVGFLSMNKDSESSTASFEAFTSKLRTFYDQLGLKYRMVYQSADKLCLSESLRLEVQMWSPLSKTYIRVASLSKHGDYVSRRILMKYFEENRLHNYHVLSGTFIDAYKVIGCMVENQ